MGRLRRVWRFDRKGSRERYGVLFWGRAQSRQFAMSDNRGMREAITRDPEVMHGTPVFRGTRVPVKAMFEYLENGDSLDDFLEGFPTVSREIAVQVLEESKELLLARV